MAPLNALAVLVGSQAGRPGVLTQAAVEEAVNLRLAMKGLVSYAETLSVYGSAEAFRDGDDTPWSKAFLASAYASRGIKVRFTSGSGHRRKPLDVKERRASFFRLNTGPNGRYRAGAAIPP
jgi:propanediol dehydratase large subunit